jgi:hypothetical protein
MRTNLVKKIISISVIAVLAAVVIATIVLALVPQRLANPIANGYGTISIYVNGDDGRQLFKNNAEQKTVYEKIEQLHADSLKDNALSSLFQGVNGYEMNVVSISTISNAINTVAKAENAKVIVFNYLGEEKQTLKINGSVYYDTESPLSSKTVQYDTVIMPLIDGADYEECSIYLADSTNSYKCSYQVRFLAHQADLYDYIANLEF